MRVLTGPVSTTLGIQRKEVVRRANDLAMTQHYCIEKKRKGKRMRGMSKLAIALALSTLCYGCGHTNVSRVALLSVGDLDGRTIPSTVDGPVLTGRDACKIASDPYFLSEAVRTALSGTQYDTLVDAEVTTKTGLFVWSNQIEVKGIGVDSKALPQNGGAR
jgi:hypothetical protein